MDGKTAKVPEARRALVLLYAHLLRLPFTNDVLRKGLWFSVAINWEYC